MVLQVEQSCISSVVRLALHSFRILNQECFFRHFLNLIDLTTIQHSLSNLYYTLLSCSLTVPNLQITKGLCSRNIIVFMPDFDKNAVGLRDQTTKAQPSPLHHVFRNLKLTLSMFLSILINLSLDKQEFHRFHSPTTVQWNPGSKE